MIGPRALLTRLARDSGGAMAIETAIVAPVLVLLAVGSFQVSSVVARQTELQNAAAVAESIALARLPQNPGDLTIIKNVLRTSANLEDDQVDISFVYRCADRADEVASEEECGESETVWTFIRIAIEDDYDPIWNQLGIGSSIRLNVDRTAQIG